MYDADQLHNKATTLRIRTLEAIHKAKSGHTGGSLSVMDILVALYYGELPAGPIMKYDPKKPGWEDQDYVVLSKGHAAPALYAVLADLGFFDKSELHYLRQVNAMLQGHPVHKIPGITVTTGSLGQGFAAAHGLALSLKLDKKKNRVFAILGDGELQEGIVWETAMAAAHYHSDNLTAIIDNNQLQIDGFTRSVMNVEPIVEKFESFGWHVIKVRNGHDFDALLHALEKAIVTTRRPTCVVCNTVKGKGVTFAEKKAGYHGVPLSEQEMKEAIPALERTLINNDS
ncbi:transketolase [Candidatus Peregrinibacteria bacterium]|nr:transketolase [Candidatus Peregrinibacteria bacterium]